MWASSSAGGATPCPRHTTMGTAQISHSAIQHTSSSWNHSVMRAASQRSHSAENSRSVMTVLPRGGSFRVEPGAELGDERRRLVGPATVEQTAHERAADDDAVGRAGGLTRLLDV